MLCSRFPLQCATAELLHSPGTFQGSAGGLLCGPRFQCNEGTFQCSAAGFIAARFLCSAAGLQYSTEYSNALQLDSYAVQIYSNAVQLDASALQLDS